MTGAAAASSWFSLGRWPHPSPWWGTWLWPKVIMVGLPALLVVVIGDGLVRNWREDHHDDQDP